MTNGQLALHDVGAETAIPLPDAARTEMSTPHLVPISSPTEVPMGTVPNPTLTKES